MHVMALAVATGGPDWLPPVSQDLVVLVGLLAGLALIPFLLTMVTSFAKLVIVGGIIRQALGTPQLPPTTVITGLALILTIHIMWPVGRQIQANFESATAAAVAASQDEEGEAEAGSGGALVLGRAIQSARGPMREFLEQNTARSNIELFVGLQATLDRDDPEVTPLDPDTLIYELTVLTPAFVLTELTEAFKIGFLIFVPFLIIDLFVSNVLISLGMMMVQPQTISLPLKLMLFVLVDGWRVIIKGLVLGYV